MSNTLDFCDAGLTEVPDHLSGQQGLTCVDLSCNKLEQIRPGSIAKDALVELNISTNKFSGMPSISWLTALTRLNLSSNSLASLGSSLAELTNLEHLELARNKLDDASVVGRLTALVLLDLSCNMLREAPLAGQTLKHLVGLDLSSNRISYLPKSIGNLSRLVSLKVQSLPPLLPYRCAKAWL